MKARRVVVAVLILVLAAAGVAYLVLRSQSEQKAILGGSGIIEVTEVQVGSQAAGQVTAVNVKEGQAIRKNQVLVQIDPRVLREQVASARAGVQAARANVDAAIAADDTQGQIDNARATVRQARAQLQIAEQQLAQATVKAPLAGVVLAVAVNRGEIGSAGQTLVTVGDLKRPKLVVYIPEPQIGQVKLAQRVTITVDGLPGRTFTGTVSQVSEQAEFTPQSVQTKDQRTKLVYGVTIRMPNPGALLKPGMPADAVISK